MADQWLSQIRGNPHLQKPETQAAMDTINDVVAKDSISPFDAARSICSTYESSVIHHKADLWSLWRTIIEAAARLDETEALRRLAGLLVEISKQPDVLDEKGIPCKSNSGMQIWRDLPDFSFYFFEHAINHILIEQYEAPRKDGATVEDAATGLKNANTFAALYLCELGHNGPPNEVSSMRKVAREHFMYTLEIPFDTPERVRRAEIYMAPATAWIAIAGSYLYQYSKSDADYKGENVEPWWIGGQYGGTVMWDKQDGLSLERWAFWKDRLREFSQLAIGSDEAKGQAAKAVDMMQDVEQAHQG